MKNKFLILFIISSGQLFAGVSGEIFTNGYHELIVRTLNAVSGLAASNNGPLIKIATSIAVLLMVIKILFNSNSRQIAGFEFLKMGAFVLAIQALFISAPDDDNHAYAVIDRISLQTTEVRQVPKGIGEFLSLFTTLEDGIMQKMELYFTTPDSLSYRQSGLGFTTSTQMEIMRSDIASEELKKTFYQYILNCKVDGDFSDETQTIDQILSTEGKNIIASLGTTKTLLTLVFDSSNGQGQVVSCKDAWNVITNGITSEAANHETAFAKLRGLTAQAYSAKVVASTLITGSASATKSARDQLEAAIARNSTLDSIKKVATFNGVTDSLLTKQLSISEISMTNSSILSNYQAQGTVPVLKALCTCFIIVVTWIVGIFSIATMNMGYIKFIVILNIWLMLWSPLFQVLNFAIDIMVESALSLYPDGVTSTNQIGIYEILGGKLSMITNLVWSVPILAFGIAKGGEMAMSQFIGAMVAPVQGAAHHTTKTDLQSATGATESWTDAKGTNHTFGMATQGATTGLGQTSAINQDGNFSSLNSGSGTATTTSSINSGNTASFNADGSGSVSSSTANASQVEAASTSLTSANAKIESLQKSLTKGNSDLAANISSAATSSQVTSSNGDAVKIGEGTSQTASVMNATANSVANSVADKNALTQSVAEDKQAAIALGAKVDSSGTLIGSAAEKLVGASASIGANGNIAIKTSDGTSFSLSKDSAFGKQFTENYSKSIANQIGNSKENTQAVADITSAARGESQSDTRSTSRQVQEAYSNQESATATFSDSKSQGSSASNAVLTSAFQNFFNNNESWKNSTPKERADFATRKLDEWNQSQDGIKESRDFINDNTEAPKMQNSVNTEPTIASGKGRLENETSRLQHDTSFNPEFVSSTEGEIKGKGNEIRNTNVTDPNIDKDVNSNVKNKGEVSGVVANKTEIVEGNVKGKEQELTNKADESVMLKAVEGAEKTSDGIKEVYKSLSGKDDNVDAEAKRTASLNNSENTMAYKANSQKTEDNPIPLVNKGWSSDSINTEKLSSAKTEDLARIYEYNQGNNKLDGSSKIALTNELESRNYDTKSNEFSGEYKPYTDKAPSIIKNGDGLNPGASSKNQ